MQQIKLDAYVVPIGRYDEERIGLWMSAKKPKPPKEAPANWKTGTVSRPTV
jgi:hypothetical protein